MDKQKVLSYKKELEQELEKLGFKVNISKDNSVSMRGPSPAQMERFGQLATVLQSKVDALNKVLEME